MWGLGIYRTKRNKAKGLPSVTSLMELEVCFGLFYKNFDICMRLEVFQQFERVFIGYVFYQL